MSIEKTGIRHAPLSNRIVLARFGKDPEVALETRDAMDEFLKALVSYCFDGKVPEPGEGMEWSFGGGDEQYEIVIKRKHSPKAPVSEEAA
ncbi:hypothetical protein [Rhizobium sp. 2MFCol3.1]|uniref:hypothetical protein n=1 Tax=Rhizobium sp. 2MFCol3.1 TaxID=1246459 RepID=UPI00035E0175|nr:hypothetical protein [Rhizobium sp. 2MFCol3.1]